ncbi:hypothetical protein HZC20_01625 [Candidatus Peregrinibacteria bacterium]|nr:hypothetical protein [Candidatus Peregrinibacteria bacterium]
MAISFDLKGKTFRHEEYKDYKATRVKAPDELYAQFPRIKELVRDFGIPIYEIEGFEADDVLGTLAKQAEKEKDIYSYIVTGDMDTLQLVTDKTKVLSTVKGLTETVIYDIPKVLGKYGISPSQVPDLKGLKGDASDNIKGVAGIGEKTATALLQKFGNLENIYEHLDEINGAVHGKLEKGKESAFLSRRLATIVVDVPVQFVLEKCAVKKFQKEKLISLFTELEFKSLIAKLNGIKLPVENQQTLF